MPQKTNTNIQNPYGQGDYDISIKSTEILRKHLLGKNLRSSYLADGNPLPPPYGIQTPGEFSYQTQSDYHIIDQKTVSEVGEQSQTNLFLDNSYGPEGGYKDVQLIDVKKVLPRKQTDYVSPSTLQPQAFISSQYTPAEILETVNITDNMINTMNSNILDDSELMRTSSGFLRRNLAHLQEQYLNQKSDGPQGGWEYDISTSPGKKELEGTDFISRITNLYFGYSTIPGNYFDTTFVPNINELAKNGILKGDDTDPFDSFQATASAIVSSLTGGDAIPKSPIAYPSPSDAFIEYMGKEQQSALFENLKYNIFRPDYTRVPLAENVEAVRAYYYIGSKNSEPSRLQSPMGAVPQDEFGRNVAALVYGPSTLAKELETVDGSPLWQFYKFGLAGEAYTDGGTLDGGWTWFGSTSVASLNAPPGLLLSRSHRKPKRKGGLLAQTQKLIDSAPLMGGARRKHAGHAIDQTSKIFNDGYKNIPKGSGVRRVSEGLLGGTSVDGYCRSWTKDNPYYKFKNMVRHKGNHLGKTNSVLTNTFNLNIAPVMGENVDTNVKQKNVKKYMFSIENLAWRGTSELQKLPLSERGPNGGRIMWFPPYDLSFGDTNSAQWNSVNFLGRPEPVYTYNYTERIGTLSWKMVVDHSSILNEIAQNTLKNVTDWKADEALHAFFAGCKEYDIYELASKFPNVSLDDLITAQNEVTEQFNANPEGTLSEETNPQPPMTGVPPNEGGSGSFSPGGGSGSFNLNDIGVTSSGGTSTNDLPGNNNSDFGFFDENPQSTLSSDQQAIQNSQNSEEPSRNLDTTKILARLLGEENYFQALQEEDEFIYNSLKRELQHFHPSFHSTTPEGLNTRLTFLLQCTRPGNTIPTVTSDGKKIVDADNTAFGAPPICVLRIGDFYHTKIAIDSVSFSYDPLVLDMNPEGIGLQPMIANVQMNFKFIGGQGLKEPVSRLQNALSFNFFGNTEMYDNKAFQTEGTPLLPNEQELITALETQQANQSSNNQGGGSEDGEEGGQVSGEQEGGSFWNFWGNSQP